MDPGRGSKGGEALEDFFWMRRGDEGDLGQNFQAFGQRGDAGFFMADLEIEPSAAGVDSDGK